MVHELCSEDNDCQSELNSCQDGFCACKGTYYFETQNETCVKCPGLRESCIYSRCCSNTALECTSQGICECLHGIENSLTCRYLSSQTPIYITASQIALSAALIMGMAALTMVVYRLCTKPRYLSARQRALASQSGQNIDSESLSYANYLRASLTSIQIRVLTRLRDRPPAYDSRNTSQISAQMPESPPPYDGVTEGLPLPPAYTEVIISTTGYINTTFVDIEAVTDSRCADGDNVSNINLSSSNNIVNNCDISQQSTDGTCDKDKNEEESVQGKTENSEENRIPM